MTGELRHLNPVEDTGFVVALHIGSWSMRLVFGRRAPRGESRRARRRRIASEELARRQREREIDLLMAAQRIIDRAKPATPLPTRQWQTLPSGVQHRAGNP